MKIVKTESLKLVKKKIRPSWSLSEEVKQQIREMREDGLTLKNIANYFGISNTTIIAITNPEMRARTSKKYYLKNREKLIEKMKIYQKTYQRKVIN